MHFSTRFAVTTAVMSLEVAAFPFIAANVPSDLTKRVNGILPGFDASAQLIDVTGEHAFTPPDFSAGDIRGPCPGLNALANHNYLPHNGVASLTQFINATTTVFGMGVDLAAFLSVLGAVVDGDGVNWSIGGPPPTSLTNILPGVLGYPEGLIGSHNKYEADSSPTRGDLYQVGNNYKLVLSQFEELYGLQKDAAAPNYDLDVLGDFRSSRWDQSVQNNPYFFNGPFTGVLVSQAAFTFIYRFMSNKSAENPEGVLNKEVLKSFFAISGPDDALVWTPGYEQIPTNWYRRAYGDEYTIPFFLTDVLGFVARYPKIASLGGNTGTVNSFTPVDVANLTGGLFDAETLLQGNNLGCFAFQIVTQLEVPDLLSVVLDKLTSAVGQVSSALSCPQLGEIDKSLFSQYPGYSKLKTGGTYWLERRRR